MLSSHSGTFAGITNSFSFNKRLQPVNMSATSPSATVFSIAYDFHLGNGDNGNVYGITNNRDATRSSSRGTKMKTYTWKQAFAQAHRAAETGNPGAQNFVGYCYDRGKGVRRNRRMARRWFEKAAQNGNIHGTFNLAVFNDTGQGMRRNASRAVRLYREAALRGDLQAQSNLAVMLLDGDGVKRDTAEGLRWLRRAAKRGDCKAQYNLGHAYAYGEDDVRQNSSLALKWLSKAARQGHTKARQLLEYMRKKRAFSRVKLPS